MNGNREPNPVREAPSRIRPLLLRTVLGILCAYHLGVGVLSLFFPDAAARFADAFYGARVGATPEVAYMLKALGMYALFTGLLAGGAALDPGRHRLVVVALAFLLLLRAATRLLAWDLLSTAFAVAPERNLANVALLVVQAGVLLACLPRGERPG